MFFHPAAANVIFIGKTAAQKGFHYFVNEYKILITISKKEVKQ